MRGSTPAITSAPSRSRSRTRVPPRSREIRSRSSWETSSEAPRRRNFRLAQPSAMSCPRLSNPARNAARPNWKAEEPSISVRSRSKKAADRPAADPLGVCLAANSGFTASEAASAAINLDDHRVALAAARADRGAAESASAPAQLEHKRAEDPRARGADRVAKRHRAAVDVDLVLVDAE